MKQPIFYVLVLASVLGLNVTLLLAREPGEDEIICVGGARLWSGSPAEIARIEIEPVPDSFRKLDSYRGPCGNGLVRWSLMNWHLRYGTAETSLAALDYLGGALSSQWIMRSPAEYHELLGEFRQQFLAAKEASSIQEQAYAEGGMFNTVSDGLYLVYRAEEVMTHAEVFQSAELSREVAPLMDAMDELSEIFALQTDGLEFRPFSDIEEVLRNFDLAVARIKARRAILKAQMSGTAGDAREAALLLKESYDPAYEYVLEEVNSGIIADCDGFGNLDSEYIDSDIEAACVRLNTNGGGPLLEAALEFYHRSYLVSLLMEPHREEFVPDLRGQIPFRMRLKDDPGSPDRIDQKTRSALYHAWENEAYLATAASAMEHLTEGLDDATYTIGDIPSRSTALSVLASSAPWVEKTIVNTDPSTHWELSEVMQRVYIASLRVPPAEWPSLWRQLADRYLTLHENYAGLLAEDGSALTTEELYRYRMFKAQLAGL